VTWLTWRQFRAQAATALAAVAAVCALAALTGPRLADLAVGGTLSFDQLRSSDRALFYAGVIVLSVFPALVGAFWGAPLVARELETGTHRLAWSQSVTRTRWLAAKLGGAALVTAVSTGLVSLAVTWWSAPLDGAIGSTSGGLPGHLTPVTFAMRGVAPVGYAVFALVLGVLTGMVLRRTLPAMAITLALYVAVQLVVPTMVRPHLAPPVTASIAISRDTLDSISIGRPGDNPILTVHTADRGDWVLVNQTVGPDGRPAPMPARINECLGSDRSPDPSAGAANRAQAPSPKDCLDQLSAAGYRQRVVYQPADRFWRLQWTETAVFLTASALLAGVCLWWVRRRLT
jgi:ABC-type transport system involved in multi-copper enzyme maturation permease subunit